MKNVVKKKFKFADTSMLYRYMYYESVGKIVMKIRLRTKKNTCKFEVDQGNK